MSRHARIKSLREKLFNSTEPSIGTWMQLGDPSIAEILSKSGYDWIAVDMEHGNFSHNELPNIFRAIELGGSLSLVRLADNKKKEFKIALDSGAAGVIIPMIETADELKQAIEWTCWPPAGKRGVGYSRANLYGDSFNEYKEEAQEPIVVAQIENISAVKNLRDILKVKGLDAIFVGPYDLSASMGITGDFDNKEFKEISKEIVNLAGEHNIPCGLHVVEPDADQLSLAIQEGNRLIAYSIDSVFLNYFAKNPFK